MLTECMAVSYSHLHNERPINVVLGSGRTQSKSSTPGVNENMPTTLTLENGLQQEIGKVKVAAVTSSCVVVLERLR